MALYSIESEQFLGMSHSGAVTVNGESTVELSDEEVDILVKLIKEKNTSDVEKLDLKNLHPAIYEKLDKAYHKLAYKTEEFHWLINGFENGCYEYDDEKVIKYCEENCGYEFVPKIENVPDNISPDFIAALIEIRKESMEWKMRDFSNWLLDYLKSINVEEACDFMYSHLNAYVDMDDVNYVVSIPQAIINKAKEWIIYWLVSRNWDTNDLCDRN